MAGGEDDRDFIPSSEGESDDDSGGSDESHGGGGASEEEGGWRPRKPRNVKEKTRQDRSQAESSRLRAAGESILRSVREFVTEREARGKVSADLDRAPSAIAAKLHPHQLVGLNWLKSRFELGVGSILSDEMGLGKTLQTICFLAYLRKMHPTSSRPVLVVSPLSVAGNWTKEFAQFCPEMEVSQYMGDKASREQLQKKVSRHILSSHDKEARRDPMPPFDVLITTYEYIISDVSFLSRFRWRVLVVDEAHRLKNASSRLYQTLMDQYTVSHRVLLTGTPCQNNVRELWSLLHFLHPKLFSNGDAFVQRYEDLRQSDGGVDEEESPSLAVELHAVMRPFVLRRLKEQVHLDIPEKRELVLYTCLTPLQRKYYRLILTRNAVGLGQDNARSLVNIISSLRKACNHPYLFAGAEPEPFCEGDHLYLNSGKFMALERLLAVLKRQSRRVLIFSQSVQALDILQDYLSYRKYSYERLDGSVRGEERYLAVERFQQGEDTFVFLLSTRAGGVGLNLTMADTVIFLDLDWNPQMDIQAIGRVHRIGQTKPVLAIKLVTRNTVEEVIYSRAQQKLRLAREVLEKGHFETYMKDPTVDLDREVVSDSESTSCLRDVIAWGLDALLSADESKSSAADGDWLLSFTEEDALRLVDGPSAGSDRKKQKREEVQLARTSEVADAGEHSVYFYEGKDYGSIETAQRELADEAADGTRLREGREALEALVRDSHKDESEDAVRARVKMAPEELAARRAKLEEEKEARRAKLQEAKDTRRKRKWEASGYCSLTIQLPESEEERGVASDEEEEDVENFLQTDDSPAAVAPRSLLQHVVGDATAPFETLARERSRHRKKHRTEGRGAAAAAGRAEAKSNWFNGGFGDAEEDAAAAAVSPSKTTSKGADEGGVLVLNCIDDSGSWGRGGFFSALSHLSSLAAESYERAGEMDDLALGDAHLVSLDAGLDEQAKRSRAVAANGNQEAAAGKSARWPGPFYVCHVVAQHRTRVKGVSGIHLSALITALRKVCHVAKELRLSVHTPRIGAGTPGFNWYGVERALRKYLAAKGVPVYVYYYRRHAPGGGSIARSHSSSAASISMPKAPSFKPARSLSSITELNHASCDQASRGEDEKAEAGDTKRPRDERAQLSNIFHECAVILDPTLERSILRRCKRLLAAFGAELLDMSALSSSSSSSSIAHLFLVTDRGSEHERAVAAVGAEIRPPNWVEECVRQKRLIDR